MAEDEISAEAAAYWAHNFTIRLLGEIGVELTNEQGNQLWNVLREVAEGTLTIASSPADMLRPYPKAKPEVRDRLWGQINNVIRRDREIALMIKRQLETIVECLLAP